MLFLIFIIGFLQIFSFSTAYDNRNLVAKRADAISVLQSPNSTPKEKLNAASFIEILMEKLASFKENLQVPNEIPSRIPTDLPSQVQSQVQSLVPKELPSQVQSLIPKDIPSKVQSLMPQQLPSQVQSLIPKDIPSKVQSLIPQQLPSKVQSLRPQLPSQVQSLLPNQQGTPKMPVLRRADVDDVSDADEEYIEYDIPKNEFFVNVFDYDGVMNGLTGMVIDEKDLELDSKPDVSEPIKKLLMGSR